MGCRPRGLPLLIFTGGQRSASFDRGSAVDGVFLCSAPSGHSESDGGLGLWAHFLTDPVSLAFAHSDYRDIAWLRYSLTLSRSVARVNLGRPRGLPLLQCIPEAGTLRHSTEARPWYPSPRWRRRQVGPGAALGPVGLSIGPTHAHCSCAMVLYPILSGWRRRHPDAFFSFLCFSLV